MDSTFSKKVKLVFCLTVAVKLVLLAVFTSGYRESLFIPFVSHFMEVGGDPWAYTQPASGEFPYPPLMLYILSVFWAPMEWFGHHPIIEGFFYGLPLLIADLIITFILLRMFPWRKTEIFIFYFASPIVLYSTYMHGQLDIIPTAMMFAGIYLLSNKHYLLSAAIMGLAISTKFHTVAAIPLMIIYLINQRKITQAFFMLSLPMAIFLIFTMPFMDSAGFNEIVLQNEKQRLIFNSFIEVGNAKIYLPVLLLAVIYLRFAVYRKINNDLIYAAVGSLFTVFLVFIEPAPGWFVWVVPFFTIFYIRYFDGFQHYFFYAGLTICYLLYYLFFYQYDHPQLIFLGHEILSQQSDIKPPFGNLVFTAMAGILLGLVYQFYKNGIKSNDVYTMERSFVIGIGGDSGAGKSTLIDYLKKMFSGQLLELEGDGDHRWERGDENWQEYTHLDPKANLLHRQADQLSQLKNRKTIQRSDYDHSTGKFTEADKIRPQDFIVLAGLHPFYLPKMRKVIDLKIFLDLDERLRRSWKIERDQKKRGYTTEQVLEALAVREKDSKNYIQPQKQFSDLIIRFYPVDEDQFDNSLYRGRLGLEIEMDASIPLDDMLHDLKDDYCEFEWDYSKDLNTQYIRFRKEPNHINIGLYATRFVTNHTELVSRSRWETGYAGMTQLLVLFAISDIMQQRAHKYV